MMATVKRRQKQESSSLLNLTTREQPATLAARLPRAARQPTEAAVAGSVSSTGGFAASGGVTATGGHRVNTRNNTCGNRVDVSVNATGTTTNSVVVSLCN